MPHYEECERKVLDWAARIEALDIAVQEVHPQYANRILDRMADLEKHARRQANQVFAIFEAQSHCLVHETNAHAGLRHLVRNCGRDMCRSCGNASLAHQQQLIAKVNNLPYKDRT